MEMRCKIWDRKWNLEAKLTCGLDLSKKGMFERVSRLAPGLSHNVYQGLFCTDLLFAEVRRCSGTYPYLLTLGRCGIARETPASLGLYSMKNTYISICM